MARILWTHDIHLNFLPAWQVQAFAESLRAFQPDAVLIAGDIGEAPDFARYLERIAAIVERPIYFVLGNHDFYHGRLATVRAVAERLARGSRWLRWLSDTAGWGADDPPGPRPVAPGVYELAPQTALVGHEGWADGRCGGYAASSVELNDYHLIHDLAGLSKNRRLSVLNRLGDEAAAHFRAVLPAALARYPKVLALTHVPPFATACWHQGRLSNDDWLPHMACGAVGEALREIMAARPDRELTVLCGHTHGAGSSRELPNLQVISGEAEYYAPAVQGVLEVP